MRRDLGRLLREARERGWMVERTAGSHWRLRHRSGAVVFTGGTPGCRRALLNFRADLRRVERLAEGQAGGTHAPAAARTPPFFRLRPQRCRGSLPHGAHGMSPLEEHDDAELDGEPEEPGFGVTLPKRLKLDTQVSVRRQLVRLYREAREGRITALEANRLANLLGAVGTINRDLGIERRLKKLEVAVDARRDRR
jgi:hypothetical protein